MDAGRRDVLKLAAFATLAGYASGPLAAASSSSAEKRTVLRSRPLMSLRLDLAPPQDIGAGPHGSRITIPITGGSFEGDRLRGKVLPSGDDWTVKRRDGVTELDLRLTLQTEDGALIHLTFQGIQDAGAPGAPYVRTVPRFETAEGKYSFLNRLLAVGREEHRAGGPVHMIEEIL